VQFSDLQERHPSCPIKWIFHGVTTNRPQIRDELARVYIEQTDFYRNAVRAKHTETELADCEMRRQHIRRLFEELDELRKTADWRYTQGKT
jgi:outer membrane lipopolysaccharide assembly protein LptE/RlpB